jgi:hypothetical protein
MSQQDEIDKGVSCKLAKDVHKNSNNKNHTMEGSEDFWKIRKSVAVCSHKALITHKQW